MCPLRKTSPSRTPANTFYFPRKQMLWCKLSQVRAGWGSPQEDTKWQRGSPDSLSGRTHFNSIYCHLLTLGPWAIFNLSCHTFLIHKMGGIPLLWQSCPDFMTRGLWNVHIVPDPATTSTDFYCCHHHAWEPVQPTPVSFVWSYPVIRNKVIWKNCFHSLFPIYSLLRSV